MPSTTPEFPRYEVLAPLGEGALATVFKVRALKDGSIRALKALKPEQAETERAVARFEDEYRILSSLHHPSLPEVYDYGVAPDGTRFIVMEYLEGEPLDEYLAAHTEDFWALLFQMNEALAFIHEHNLLHLDLKPGNILVRRSRAFGEREMPLLMLIDFGLSYRRESGGAVKLVGTPAYMSPEVIRGEENITRAADYYSLGVILYELTEGRLPFTGSMHDILRAHLTRKVTFEGGKVEFAELVPWIERLMAKEQRERLAAFQDYRRTMAVRMGDDAAAMDRVYALGYIDSLGLVGKEEAWDELRAWGDRLAAAIQSRSVSAGDSGEISTTRSGGDVPDPGDILMGSLTDLEKRIQEDLLASAAIQEQVAGPITDVPRVLAVSGPPESGKTHVLRTLATELRVRGLQVLRLGEDSDYHTIVKEAGKKSRRPLASVDPAALTTDRFVAGWDKIVSFAEGAGVVLMADDLARLSGEEREFLEYVGKRLGHVVSEATEPNVFVICVGKSKPVRDALRPALIGDGAFASVEVPPPGNDDVEAISGRFRGHLSGRNEQKSLEVFLRKHLQSSTAIYASLKQGITDGALNHRIGKWAFHESQASSIEFKTSSAEYYKGLFEELAGNEKELVGWLACHPQPLTIDELSRVSGLSADKIAETGEALLPYRIIDVADTEKGRRIAVISDHIRDGMYKALLKKDRDRIHDRYIDHFEDHGDDSIGYFEMMALHYAKVRRVRESLIMQVRAVTKARRERDVFALRRLCKAGIEYVRRLRSADWKDHKWLIERYFIKQWVNAEWMVSNYRNLVKVIKGNLLNGAQTVPVGFLYRFSIALERSNDLQASSNIVESGINTLKSTQSEAHFQLLIQQANLLCASRRFDESLRLLSGLVDSRLSTEALARAHVIRMLNYERKGDKENFTKYLTRARTISSQNNHVEHLLRVNYSDARFCLNQSRYIQAKRIIAGSIRIARKGRNYRGLCLMYFMASGVFYEEGCYEKALGYLDKAVAIAVDNGMLTEVNEYSLRYAMNYQNLGLWGDAIRSVESIIRRVDKNDTREQYFYGTLLLFDLLSSIHSRESTNVQKRLESMLKGIREHYRVALYYHILGTFFVKRLEFSKAITNLKKAQSLYHKIQYDDDVARVNMLIATVQIKLGEYRTARTLIDKIKTQIDGMESNDIVGGYCALELMYHRVTEENDADLHKWIYECEKIREGIMDISTSMRMDASLFQAFVKLGQGDRAAKAFRSYYGQVRKIVSGLKNQELVADFSEDPEFRGLVQEYRSN